MNAIVPQDGAEILERVIIQGDLSKLSPIERVSYYKQVCDSANLNPLMKPFEFLTLNGKLVLYALRSATDQLRKFHHVSITILSRERVEDTYLVTAQAKMPDGRTDESMGAVNLKGLTGDALANAFLKCETKAKRRVTLSICGLGMLDETEVDSIPGARITPSAGVEEQLTREEMIRAEEVVAGMRVWLADGAIGDAVYHMENCALNAEQQIYAWTFFDSKQRSAMKKEQARIKAAAKQLVAPQDTPGEPNRDVSAGTSHSEPDGSATKPAIPSSQGGASQGAAPILITDAARKRLEARISEFGLDRAGVKKYVKDTFGKDHFKDMTKDEYDKLDQLIEIRAAKAELKAAQSEDV